MIKLFDIIYEENRYRKETGESFARWKDLIQKYEQGGDHYVHFSNVPRVGLYLVNKYDTPIGFYSYPLIFNKMSDFAVDRPYAIIFKIKPEARILDLGNYFNQDFERDIKILKEKYGISDKEIGDWMKTSRVRSAGGGYLWNITRNISLLHGKKGGRQNYELGVVRGGGSTGKWSMILNKDLGYDGVVDPGRGIIHSYEPSQAVFFNTRSIQIVDILNLQKGKIKTKADFTKDDKNLSGKDLKNSDYSNQILKGVNFYSSDLEEANFQSVELMNCILNKTNLKLANLKFSYIENSQFGGVDFKDANLEGATINKSNFKDAIFTDLTLAKVYYSESNLKNVNFDNTVMASTKFYSCDLSNAKIKNANLKNARFSVCTLKGANFSGSVFEKVDFQECSYDKHTKFPAGFDPTTTDGLFLD